MDGAAYVVICVSFGLAAGLVGRSKGSSFLIWFAIGAVIPGRCTIHDSAICAGVAPVFAATRSIMLLLTTVLPTAASARTPT